MSARQYLSVRALERDALAAVLARYAPKGAVRVAEALAAAALNRRRRAETLWGGAFAAETPAYDALYQHLPPQPISAQADAAWNRACRRIAARALADATPDPTNGGHYATPIDAPAPPHAPMLTARIGSYAFYRDEMQYG
jgi:hypothetical protein